MDNEIMDFVVGKVVEIANYWKALWGEDKLKEYKEAVYSTAIEANRQGMDIEFFHAIMNKSNIENCYLYFEHLDKKNAISECRDFINAWVLLRFEEARKMVCDFMKYIKETKPYIEDKCTILPVLLSVVANGVVSENCSTYLASELCNCFSNYIKSYAEDFEVEEDHTEFWRCFIDYGGLDFLAKHFHKYQEFLIATQKELYQHFSKQHN